MATAPALETESTSIIVAVHENPALVLIDAGKRDDLYTHIRREVAEFVPDLTTLKGREEIKSFAYKITRTKTAIDDAGKRLNEESRAQINVVDAARRESRETLGTLATEVRRPLTEWEEAEKQRAEDARALIAQFKEAAIITMDDTAATVRQRGTDVWNIPTDVDALGELFEEAVGAKNATVATLKAALARLTQEETDRAELERLRQEAAERAEADRIAAEEKARAEAEQAAAQRAADEARQADERRVAAEKAEAERLEAAKEAAAKQAREEAEATAKKEADERAAAARAEVEAANARAAEADAARKAESDRIAKEAAAREAEEKRLADEQAKRDADQKHRTDVKTAAKVAMINLGCPADAAVKIVLAMIAGDIPHVTLRF